MHDFCNAETETFSAVSKIESFVNVLCDDKVCTTV